MCSSPFATSIDRTRMGFSQVGQIQTGGGNDGSNSRGWGNGASPGADTVGSHHLPNGASSLFLSLHGTFGGVRYRPRRNACAILWGRFQRREWQSGLSNPGRGPRLRTAAGDGRRRALRLGDPLDRIRTPATARCAWIVRHRTAAMELEHGVGFVDCDDNPDGLHQRAVRHPLASETVTKCAGRELFKGQAAATRSGFPLIWGHHVMGTLPHINFS